MALYYANVELTKETIKATEQWFITNRMGCINEVLSGEVKVNDPTSYFDQCFKEAREYLTGSHKISLTFLQRAHFIQTGKSVPLLNF